ncbi:hypothetical protein [Rhodohalobacter sp. 8-1]|uniref:hypothetical protein n=1 Tax=Rhodohalobacter sp. 8-1 TaxID=3131972 RepID=UPI0030EC6696
MKNFTQAIVLVLMFGGLYACTSEPAQDEALSEPNLVEVKAIYDAENDRHLFATETDTIPAGWTTFRLLNASPYVHFIFFDYLPGDRTSVDLMSDVSPVFQESSYLLMEGKQEEAMAAFSKLPGWFSDLVFRGGTGYTSPGRAAETTLFMAPGNYVMECYIKMPDGTYHWKKGMYKDLHVSADTTQANAPASPDIEITVTDDGLQVEGEPRTGDQLVAVHFEQENPGLLGKDVHLARLDESTDAMEVAEWLDFMTPEGLVSTAENPGPATFIGGTHEMPKGNTAYFTVREVTPLF